MCQRIKYTAKANLKKQSTAQSAPKGALPETQGRGQFWGSGWHSLQYQPKQRHAMSVYTSHSSATSQQCVNRPRGSTVIN